MKLPNLLFLLFVSSLAYCQDNSLPQSQQPRTFSLNPDDLGALENSVNLFTGQVSFPMSIASTPGRGGLGISVNILYNSSVSQSVGKWNVEYPTGILGLGWTLEIPRIVCNNKLTGARADDEFYLVEGGQSKKLVCRSSTNYPRVYDVKSPDFWKVEYYALEEKWVITKENGFKFIYGGQNSGRNTVQWIVRWGNWIGNSVTAANQQQQAYIWNIAEIENLWGEKLLFEYENIEEFVAKDLAGITTQKKHTKASYVKRIVDPAGYSVDFLYSEKIYEAASGGVKEFQDPHNGKAEPDAYQEKYETRFLDRIVVNNHDGSLLYETDLDYRTDLIGFGDQVKRVLTSIKSIYPSGRSAPPVKFEYFNSGSFIGSLKKVTNSYGAYYDYTYKRSEIPLSNLDITVDAPTPGQWKEHYVYTGNDYVIVVWRTVNSDGSHNADWRPSKIWLYHWDGKWNKKDLTENTEFGYVNLKTRENVEKERVLDWQIVLGDYFFSYLYPRQNLSTQYEGRIWHRKESSGNDWNLQTIGTGIDRPVLLSGDHFVATSNLREPIIKTYVFNGDGISFMDVDASNEEAEYFLNATNNYIFVHNDNGGNQDYIHVVHLSEDKKWIKTSAPASQLFRTDGDGFRISYWHSFNSFSMGLPWDNAEFIYTWNENYNGIRRTGGWGRLPDDSYVFSRGNNMLSVVPNLDDRNIESPFFPIIDFKSARYNGSTWQFNEFYATATFKNVALGSDFTIHDVWPKNLQRRAFLQEYDPNIPAWKSVAEYLHSRQYLNTKEGLNRNLAIEAGPDGFVIGDGDYYMRDMQGVWSFNSKLKLGSNEYLLGKSLVLSPSLIAYEYSIGKNGAASGSYLVFLENGQIKKTERFPGWTFDTKPIHVGFNLVAHVVNDTKLILHRITDGKFKGRLYANHVTRLKWYDGNKTFTNAYDYNLNAAKADPSGGIAYFNKVGVIQGSPNTIQRPFGHKDFYFLNDLKPNELLVKPINLHSQASNLGIGEIYQTSIINSTADTVAYSKAEYIVLKKFIKNSDNKTVDVDSYLRPGKTIQMQDNIIAETVNQYQSETGLLDYTSTKNSSRKQQFTIGASSYWSDENENRNRYFTYWWEIYDPQRTSGTWLSEVVQITDTYFSNPVVDTTSSVVTRWKTWENGRKAPDVTYGWLRKNNVSFNAWNYPNSPNGTQWKLANEILKRDALTGFPLESKNTSGLEESVLYDDTRTRVLAKAINAKHNAIAYTSFEQKSKGNWIFNDSAVVKNSTSLTGENVFKSSAHEISSALLSSGTYVLSFYTQDSSAQVNVENGNVTSSQTYPPRVDDWTLHKYIVNITNSNGKIKLTSGGGGIDELRLHPLSSKITSYTYNSFGSMTSESSSNFIITYYTYDELNRPFLIKDQERNIVKRFDYRYRDEEENMSALIQYSDTLRVANPVEFHVNHPKYFRDSVSYEWDFGDGNIVLSDGPSINHTYSMAGAYNIKVRVKYANAPEINITDLKPIQIPDGLVATARITAGFNPITSCAENPNTQPTDFGVTIINSSCQGINYTWYLKQEDSEPTQIGTGVSISYVFSFVGEYQVYCTVSNSCGESVNTPWIGIVVQGGSDYCGGLDQN